MGGVFISYRGGDSYSYGPLIHAELSRRFGADQVFLDSESIPAGEDFSEVCSAGRDGAGVPSRTACG